jgi:hypothetical protein
MATYDPYKSNLRGVKDDETVNTLGITRIELLFAIRSVHKGSGRRQEVRLFNDYFRLGEDTDHRSCDKRHLTMANVFLIKVSKYCYLIHSHTANLPLVALIC